VDVAISIAAGMPVVAAREISRSRLKQLGTP